MPAWVGDELRQVRRGGEDANLAAVRAEAEASPASRKGCGSAAARHEVLAASYRAMAAAYRQRESVLAGVMDGRAERDRATAHQRRLAIAAGRSRLWHRAHPIDGMAYAS